MKVDSTSRGSKNMKGGLVASTIVLALLSAAPALGVVFTF
jgi:hypothetical protein